ncbi:isocyanide synthase family protein [bacterium]|nr:isocyanide synthase family protein [bacterium]
MSNELTITKQSELILELLINQSNFYEKGANLSTIHQIHNKKLLDKLSKNEKIQFTLPAFPAKSGNREKTFSNLPDVAEIQALKGLNQLAQKIHKITQNPVEILICSDGRVFCDLVGITEEDVSLYAEKLKEIKEQFDFQHLSFFNLEDVFKEQDNFETMRDELEENFANNLDFIRDLIKRNEAMKQLFNGIHRFMKEDYLVIKQGFSKTKILKLAKEAAYKVIQRSNAWGRAVEKFFPDSIRLSIHPQPILSEKFPVKLVPGAGNWGTPWHRVALVEDGEITLVRHSEAIHLGAQLKRYKDQFAYFEKENVS